MIGNLLRTALFAFVLGGSACFSAAASAQTLALVGGSVYASPDAAPLADAVVADVQWRHHRDRQPQRSQHSRRCARHRLHRQDHRCRLLEQPRSFHGRRVEKRAAARRRRRLQEHMQEMLTKWGFTTVWDLGSDPRDSLLLRRRVNAGEVLGPIFCLPATFSPRAAIPPICRPSCSSPKPPRRMKRRKWRAAISEWASTASSFSPASTWATSRS